MIPVIIPIGPHYIKKEDAMQALKGKRVYSLMIGIALLMVPIILTVFVTPKLESLYTDFNITMPFYVTYGPYIALLFSLSYFLYTLFFLFTKPSESEFNTKLSNYKAGEMIRTDKLLGPWIRQQALIILALGVIIAIFTFSYIYPVYQLAGK